MSSENPDSSTAASVRLSVDEALRTRRSVRAFLPRPVERTAVEELLALASRSPSGSNIQPWKVHVFSGALRQRITTTILEAIDRGPREQYQREWNYYPVNWREPYIGRRRKIGWDLYGLLGIAKGDFERTEQQRRQNYEFFGAPVGMIFTLEEDLEIGSWLDLGHLHRQSDDRRARPRAGYLCAGGIRRLPHAHPAPARHSRQPDHHLRHGAGLRRPDALVNRLATERAPVAQFANFDGFEG